MANEGHTSLQVLETRVRQLILAYHELEKERDNLRLTLERRERALEEAQQEMENAMFEKTLELFPNKSVAADVLGIHRTTFSRKINKPEE